MEDIGNAHIKFLVAHVDLHMCRAQRFNKRFPRVSGDHPFQKWLLFQQCSKTGVNLFEFSVGKYNDRSVKERNR